MAGLTREQRAERARLAAEQAAADVGLVLTAGDALADLSGTPQPDNHVAPAAVKTVPMVRDSATNPKPHAADVHPDEVENYRAAGWMLKTHADNPGA